MAAERPARPDPMIMIRRAVVGDMARLQTGSHRRRYVDFMYQSFYSYFIYFEKSLQ